MSNKESLVPTPHIGAQAGDFAKTVLMPGDPLRAKFIAETYLEDARLVTSIRNMLGYTGTYKGKKVSVMGSGVGIPSMCLYSYELYNFYDVDNIIRVGTAGGIKDGLKVMDIVAAIGACTDSGCTAQFELPGTFALTASYELLFQAVKVANDMGIKIHVGNVISTDTFYSAMKNVYDPWKKMGVLAAEMETAGLYMNAVKANKNALSLLTVSDHMYTGESTSAEERELKFGKMVEIALELA